MFVESVAHGERSRSADGGVGQRSSGLKWRWTSLMRSGRGRSNLAASKRDDDDGDNGRQGLEKWRLSSDLRQGFGAFVGS